MATLRKKKEKKDFFFYKDASWSGVHLHRNMKRLTLSDVILTHLCPQSHIHKYEGTGLTRCVLRRGVILYQGFHCTALLAEVVHSGALEGEGCATPLISTCSRLFSRMLSVPAYPLSSKGVVNAHIMREYWGRDTAQNWSTRHEIRRSWVQSLAWTVRQFLLQS